MNIILKYFSDFDDRQCDRFARLQGLYAEWNEKINVISRKDIDLLYERHVLHSLSIAKFTKFASGSSILDIGTGGGFPGIPLAIMFPDVKFTLVDSIAKKIKVVNGVAEALDLDNVEAFQGRVENIKDKFDFVVCRAVTAMPAIVGWMNGKIKSDNNNTLPNGIICLKGGDLGGELSKYQHKTEVVDLSTYFEEDFFDTKKIVYFRY
ncbi:MAG: 16S rRNA (guanine(527)-N(7))-methyltransferase RsmG [Bacteroidales bacterium]